VGGFTITGQIQPWEEEEEEEFFNHYKNPGFLSASFYLPEHYCIHNWHSLPIVNKAHPRNHDHEIWRRDASALAGAFCRRCVFLAKNVNNACL